MLSGDDEVVLPGYSAPGTDDPKSWLCDFDAGGDADGDADADDDADADADFDGWVWPSPGGAIKGLDSEDKVWWQLENEPGSPACYFGPQGQDAGVQYVVPPGWPGGKNEEKARGFVTGDDEEKPQPDAAAGADEEKPPTDAAAGADEEKPPTDAAALAQTRKRRRRPTVRYSDEDQGASFPRVRSRVRSQLGNRIKRVAVVLCAPRKKWKPRGVHVGPDCIPSPLLVK